MGVKIEFETANAAFQDGRFDDEVLRIFHEIAEDIRNKPGRMNYGKVIHDANGSMVGSFTVVES